MLDTVTKWQFDFIRWGGGIFNILLSVYLEMQKWRALYSDYKRYRPPIKTQGRPAEAEETLRKNMSQEEKKGGICSQQLWHTECLKIPRCLIALCLNCSQCDQIVCLDYTLSLNPGKICTLTEARRLGSLSAFRWHVHVLYFSLTQQKH